jgi:hypothetical protein
MALPSHRLCFGSFRKDLAFLPRPEHIIAIVIDGSQSRFQIRRWFSVACLAHLVNAEPCHCRRYVALPLTSCLPCTGPSSVVNLVQKRYVRVVLCSQEQRVHLFYIHLF